LRQIAFSLFLIADCDGRERKARNSGLDPPRHLKPHGSKACQTNL
jgi:hypothetical protein